MESYLQASETRLVDSLNYENAKVAEYILGRKQVSIPASGGNQYGPNGSRTARFSVTTSGPFVDLSTVAIKGTVKNTTGPTTATDTGAKSVQFLGPNLGTLFSSVKVFAGNVQIDSVDYYNRTEAMLSLLQSESKRRQEYSEGFGYVSGSEVGTDFVSTPIARNTSKTVVYRPKALGCLQTHLYLPTSFISGGGVVIEATFVDNADDVVEMGTGKVNTWEVENLSLLCDVVQVDSSFLTSLGAHLAKDGSITMHYKAYSTSFYNILASNAQITYARANTRLNSIFLTLMGGATAANLKAVNRFRTGGPGMKMRSQVGEATYPDHAISSRSEFFHRLMHATGSAGSASHSPCLTSASYAEDGFIAIQDFEACPHQAAGTGVNTFNSQLSIALEDIAAGGTGATGITGAFLTSYHDVVMEVSQAGVTVAV